MKLSVRFWSDLFNARSLLIGASRNAFASNNFFKAVLYSFSSGVFHFAAWL